MQLGSACSAVVVVVVVPGDGCQLLVENQPVDRNAKHGSPAQDAKKAKADQQEVGGAVGVTADGSKAEEYVAILFF